ncbi:MAG: HobA family DNA replication regulator [Helicobacteraceae bacterium]|nr:HobA family DNA replication regulator [Helicobacteraceae bacterium]
MEQLIDWTLAAIRSDGPFMGWMEERRFDWVPVVSSSVGRLIEGAAFVVVTDKDREWFGKYLVNTLNRPEKKRPMLPIFNIGDIADHLDRATEGSDIDMIENMLHLAFGERYLFWYIGKSDDRRAKLPKKSDDSLLWIMDEEVQNSFFMRSLDDLLDVKLMHMARLIDRTISAVMFGEVNLSR